MIKNPTVLRYGYRYEFKISQQVYGKHYVYAEPVDYADNSYLGDCWITDCIGNVHPGYSISPVPVMASQLCNGVEIVAVNEDQ
jgi:hypothetical protein